MLLLKLGANGHLWSVVVCVRMSLCMPRARAGHKLSSKPWLLFPFLAPSRPQASPRDSPLFPGGLPGPLVEQWAPPPRFVVRLSPAAVLAGLPCHLPVLPEPSGQQGQSQSCCHDTCSTCKVPGAHLGAVIPPLRLSTYQGQLLAPGLLGREEEGGFDGGGASCDIKAPLSPLLSREYHTL